MIIKKIRLEQVLSLPLLLAALLCAAYFRGTDTIWFAPSISFFALWGFVLLLPGLRQGWEVPKSATLGLVGLFWGYLFLALSWSTAPFISILFTLVFSTLPAGLFILAVIPEQRKIAYSQLYLVLGTLAVLAFWAWLQFLFFYDDFGPRIKNPFLNPNTLAALLNLGLLPSIAFFAGAETRNKTAMWGGAIVLFFGALLVTQGRAALLAADLSLIVMLPFVFIPFTREKRRRFVGLGALLLLAAGAINSAMTLFHQQEGMLGSFIRPLGASMIDRGSLWISTFRMFLDHFWQGTGFSTFSYYYPAYRMPQDVSDGFFAHMDPLQFAAETGVLAPVLFYTALLAILIRTIKALNRAGRPSRERTEIIASFAALLAVLLHTHLTFHLYILAILIPLGIFLGYWFVATRAVLADPVWTVKITTKTGRSLAFALMVVLALWPVQWISRAAYGLGAAAEIEKMIGTAPDEEIRSRLDRAALIAPDANHNLPYLEAVWRLNRLQQSGKTLTPAVRAQTYQDALAYVDKAMARNQGLVGLKSTKAQLLYMAGPDIVPEGREKAIALLKEVLKLNPLYLNARIGLARLYQEEGELRKALAVLEEGLRWPRVKGQSEINFLVRIAHLHRALGDQAGYEKMIAYAGQKARLYGLTRPAKPAGASSP